MSKFREFFEKINTDQKIGTEFIKIVTEQAIPVGMPFAELNDEQLAALLPVVKKAGLECTLEEAKEYFAKIGDSELSEDELEAVAGGKGETIYRECQVGIVDPNGNFIRQS